MARENARLLMQAQTDINALSGQMAAGAEGTRKQVEWYEGQAQTTQTAEAASAQTGRAHQGQGSTIYVQGGGAHAGWGPQQQFVNQSSQRGEDLVECIIS
jgi:hypothetical protein